MRFIYRSGRSPFPNAARAVGRQYERKREEHIVAFEGVQTSYIRGVIQVVHGESDDKSRGKAGYRRSLGRVTLRDGVFGLNDAFPGMLDRRFRRLPM